MHNGFAAAMIAARYALARCGWLTEDTQAGGGWETAAILAGYPHSTVVGRGRTQGEALADACERAGCADAAQRLREDLARLGASPTDPPPVTEAP